jgi:hypothetical protein
MKKMNSSSDSINDDDDDDGRRSGWGHVSLLDDENLRSYLQGGCGNRIVDEEKRRWMVNNVSGDIGDNNGGLELLVHRTTDFVIDDDNVNDDNDADDEKEHPQQQEAEKTTETTRSSGVLRCHLSYQTTL